MESLQARNHVSKRMGKVEFVGVVLQGEGEALNNLHINFAQCQTSYPL